MIETPRLLLLQPPPEAAARVAAYFAENRDHHGPWDAPRAAAFYTEAHWRERLETNRRELAEDKALRLFVFRRDDPDGPAAGTCNFSNFARGPFQACYLGYGLDRRAVGQGLMTEALAGAIAHVFGPLRLHRIMANHVPENLRSARVLARLGFVVEGLARDYLFVGGRWRDHVLTALTNPEPIVPAAV